MQKQLIPGALALILALSAGSSYAPANAPQDGVCPKTFHGPQQVTGHVADRNEDGYVCFKVVGRGNQRVFLFVDNRVPQK